MRNLASVQEVADVRPIDGADAIEVCRIMGWDVVARKGEFKVGDKCVYCEIDSLLPFTDWSKFLWKKGDDGKTQYRLKTVKLRGQVSQGLILPMSVLDGKKFSSDKRDNPTYPFNVGMNVSELLGIVKYEPPVSAQLMGMAKGSFPSFIPKTDETRVQSAPDVLNEIIGKNCYISVKMDGSSGTFYFSHGEFGVCSRNIEFKPEDTSTFSKVAVKYDLKAKMQSLGRNIAIQGEVCGPSIQKNRLELKEHDLFVFNVYDIDKGSYISVKEAKDIVESIGLKFVPIEYIGEFNRLWDVPTLLVMAKGKYPNTNNNREGIVIRPVYEAYSPSLKGRLSFKVINNDYLLSGGD